MKYFLGILLFVFSAIPALGQSKQGNLTAASTDCSVANSCLSMALSPAAGAASITLAGTFSGTANFELSGDNGVTWVAAPTASSTSAGVTNFNVAGYSNIRVRINPFTSGTFNVTIYAGSGSKLGSSSGIGNCTVAGGAGVVQASSGAGGCQATSITDNGTNVATTEQVSSGGVGASNGGYTYLGSTSGSVACNTNATASLVSCNSTWQSIAENATGSYQLNGRTFANNTAPTIAAGGCGGSAASITAGNGTLAFDINVGTTPTSGGCTVTMPTASNGWTCLVNDFTTISSTVFVQKQTASGTTSITLKTFDTTGTAQAPSASDIYHVACTGH